MKLKNRTKLEWQPWKWWQSGIVVILIILILKIDTTQAFELLKYLIDQWIGS